MLLSHSTGKVPSDWRMSIESSAFSSDRAQSLGHGRLDCARASATCAIKRNMHAASHRTCPHRLLPSYHHHVRDVYVVLVPFSAVRGPAGVVDSSSPFFLHQTSPIQLPTHGCSFSTHSTACQLGEHCRRLHCCPCRSICRSAVCIHLLCCCCRSSLSSHRAPVVRTALSGGDSSCLSRRGRDPLGAPSLDTHPSAASITPDRASGQVRVVIAGLGASRVHSSYVRYRSSCSMLRADSLQSQHRDRGGDRVRARRYSPLAPPIRCKHPHPS